MSLSALAKNAVKTAFTVFSEQVEKVTINSYGASSDWSVSAGKLVRTETALSDIDMLPFGFKSSAMKGETLQEGEEGAIFQYDDVSSVTFKSNDRITRPDGSKWLVISSVTDPAKGSVTIRMKRQDG